MPCPGPFNISPMLITSMTSVLSLTQMLVVLSLYVMLSILLSILVCAATNLIYLCLFGECPGLCTICHSWRHTGVVHLSLQTDGKVAFEDIPNAAQSAMILPVERGTSAVECQTRNQWSPCSNPPLLPFRSLGIFVLSTRPQFTQLYTVVPAWATTVVSGLLSCTATLSMSRHVSTLNYLPSADTCPTRTVIYWLSVPAIMDRASKLRVFGGHFNPKSLAAHTLSCDR